MINTSKSGNPWGYLDRNRPRNIVFYGRVSTEHEAQRSALENQMQWYEDQAKYHPNWNVVGKYIDEGITGTQAKKRPAFLRMLEDARAGKFDLIVTREVCRFARNTVDTLVTTRELKNIGVEVYFVEDNIWTMDGDGELRLTIMATLAQEESRKVSERVRAGQHISREKGTLYGSGNILGYERVGSTYVLNPDQAETVRMIFEMYLNEGIGTGKIANRLTEMGRLNASGLNKWSHGVVSRILNNQTYMGVMAYGKSYSNNYLEQKRVNNHDKSSYICVEGDFPPIVTPEEWYRAQEIKAGRVKENFSAKKGKKTTHCVQENRDLWGSRLRCICGCSFRKNVWHKYDDKPNTYGYQCYNIKDYLEAMNKILWDNFDDRDPNAKPEVGPNGANIWWDNWANLRAKNEDGAIKLDMRPKEFNPEDYDNEDAYYAAAADWMANWGEAIDMWALDNAAFCKYMVIRIKGEVGGEEAKLIMDWHPEDAKFYAARFSDLVLADGTHPVITTEWQDLVIDLEASGFPGMTNALHIRAFADCVIWIDEIYFSEPVGPIDTTDSSTIQAGLTAPETGKPAELPIKDYVAALG